MSHPLDRLMPEVADAVSQAHTACDAVARRAGTARTLPMLQAEAALRAAHAGLLLDGVQIDLDELRQIARGQVPLPAGPMAAVVSGVLRVAADVQRTSAGTPEWTPSGEVLLSQRLAGWHALAAEGLGAGAPGRLREAEQPSDPMGLGPAPVGAELAGRIAGLSSLVAQPLPFGMSGLAVAAVVHGELLAMRPFAHLNGVVARAVLRSQLVTLGVDRTGLVVPEIVWAGAPDRYLAAAAGYATGDWAAVVGWVRSVATAVLRAADVALGFAEDAGRS